MNASRVKRESARILKVQIVFSDTPVSQMVPKKILIVACNASGAQQHDALLAVRLCVLTEYPVREYTVHSP